jgi:hypothetical protein
MAEIKVTTSTTKKTVTGRRETVAEQVSTERHTTVHSHTADRVTAWHLRDFVRALDDAKVPDKTLIDASHGQNFHLTGLAVKFSETLDEEANEDPIARS